MEHSVFTKLAALEISHLYDILEVTMPDIDMDILTDVLHIYTSKGEYVVNQHSPSKQIWLSSPVSNVGYFSYDHESGQWLDKNKISLKDRLLKDLS